ncbi:cytochrome P450 [Xylariaceae sp. FL0804]|nr:cytochrome P450 [Xylariaceae sp. FL0804]
MQQVPSSQRSINRRRLELPYWIPGLVYSFFWRSVELMESGINYMGRTHDLFAIQLPGRKLYIITRPSEVTEIFNNRHGINSDSFLREMLVGFGVAGDDFKRAWHTPQPGDWSYVPNDPINPQHMCFIKWVQDSYRKYLLTPSTLEHESSVFVDSLLEDIRPGSLSYCLVGEENKFSLYLMVRNVMVEASIRAMLGPHLHEIDPNVAQHMLSFNDHGWQVVSRNRMMTIMKQFVARPAHRNRFANSRIRNVLTAMETTQLGIPSRADMMLMILLAAISNGYNGTFWLMAHSLHDECLLGQIRRETEAAWESGELNTKVLTDDCPVLDAASNEVLRLKNAATLHTNKNVWGDRCLEFNYSRFLEMNTLARHASFRPSLGWGATYCPGRTLAKREAFSAVAIFLHRFDLRFAVTGQKRQPFPGMDVIVEMVEKQVSLSGLAFRFVTQDPESKLGLP